uniref:Endosome-associated-trafficking regulator 1 n=3 Tax=Clytia hemisphaerica TaxID=252671 RepID=A0A7M5WVJ3_9CNID
IVEDLDSVTDIFADLPSPSVDDKSLKIKVKEEDEDIFAEDANLEGITFTSKITDGDNLSDASDDSSSSPLTDSYLLSDPAQEPNKKILEELDQLKLQNAELIRELEMVKKKHRKENQASNQKISNLEKDLKKARKKEAEDTKALEDAVKMVEENLRKTTERAIKAEANVSKLKEELHVIKEGNVSLADYKNLQMQHFHQLNTIKEKSQNAARLMRAAADKTEPQIRELQSGITSLRFLADTFDDIGMVSELPKKSDTNDR